MESLNESYDLIIAGVGGQGNVLISQLIGQAFIQKGFFVTIGETYGMAQRGGPVMSHIRIDRGEQSSPLIPKGKGKIIVALEPVEALRVLETYGNPHVVILVNTRPIYPMDVTTGNSFYPDLKELRKALERHSMKTYFIDATDRAIQLNSPILTNMIMIGALLGLKLIPLDIEDFREILFHRFSEKLFEINAKAIEEGETMIQEALQDS